MNDEARIQYEARRAIAIPAQNAVGGAIKKGLLPRLDGSIPCKDCGKPAEHYDHREYSKPLEVEPVCRTCNFRRGPAKEVVHLRMRPFIPKPVPKRI